MISHRELFVHPRTALSNYLKKWFDKLPEESGSEDILLKESDTTNGMGSICPFVLPDSLIGISLDSAAVNSLSKDGRF